MALSLIHILLVPKQFGFRVGHSTTHQLMRLVEYTTGAGGRKEQTVACFLYVAEAFDRDVYKRQTLPRTILASPHQW